jgi:acyl-CoA thioester hydrolase
VRVRYPEADRMGVAYHAHYFVWFEMARTELMRELGCPYRELEDREGIYFPVIRAEARYVAPARYDDWLEIRASLEAVGGARVRFEYAISRRDEGEILATGFTEHATVGRDGRPRRIPRELRGRLQGPGAAQAPSRGAS